MQRITRIMAALLLAAMLIPQVAVLAAEETDAHIEKILGYYECTASDEKIMSDVFLAILRTEDLQADHSLVETYVDLANQRRGDRGWDISAESIVEFIENRDAAYTCLMHAPDIANGLWVFNVRYSEDTDCYRFSGGHLFPDPYYGYVTLENMVYRDGVLTGEAQTGAFYDVDLGKVVLTKKDSAADSPTVQSSMEVYTDHTGLNIEASDTITLMAAVKDGQQNLLDPSGITFQLTDSSILQILDNGIRDGQFYLVLRGELEGITFVNFSDSATGETVSVPVTVTENNQRAFTLSNVPQLQVGELVTNFYNFSGLYIDNYRYDISDDQTARVSFDVYNTNYIYGIVEVYNEAGKLENAVLINKMTGNNTSIKKVLWDGPMCMVRDCIMGNSSNYRKEFEFSIHTPVQVDIPKNGYIKITVDPMESNLLGVVNSADYTMSVLSLMGQLHNFSTAEEQFAKDLTMNLVKDAAFAQLREDGSKAFLNIDKDLAKELAVTPTAIGDFTDTLSRQLEELNVMEVVGKSLADSGVDFAEGVLKKLMGTFGIALDGVFVIGKAENVACAYIDYVAAFHDGAIRLQNQGGGFRAAGQVRLESDVDFAPEVAAQVYTVALDQELLDLVKKADRETYEMLTKGIMHTYNISLVKNGEKVQHSDPVTVYIPIPEDLWFLSLAGNVSVYRIEEDGTLTDMHAVVDDGTIRFDTDHFSLYAVVKNTAKPDKTEEETTATEEDFQFQLKGLLPIALLGTAVLTVGIVVAVLITKNKRS